MKKVLLVVPVLVLLSLATYLFQDKLSYNGTSSYISPTLSPTQTPEVNIQASFLIYTNGTRRIFDDPKYHSQSKDVFIEKDNPSVIKVKRDGVTWGDFFKTLPMKLEDNCLITGTGQVFCNNQSSTLKFYLNKTRDNQALDKVINDGDQLVVSYGPKDEPPPQEF